MKLSPYSFLVAAVICGLVSAVVVGDGRAVAPMSRGAGHSSGWASGSPEASVPDRYEGAGVSAAPAADAGLLVEVECPNLETARALSGLNVRLALPGRLIISLKPGEESPLAGAGLGFRILDHIGHGSSYYLAPDYLCPQKGMAEIQAYPELGIRLLRGSTGAEGPDSFAGSVLALPDHASPAGWFPAEPPEEARSRRVGALAREAALEVDPGNIESIIDELSYDADADTLLTRYSRRSEINEIALPYLESLLRENLGLRGTVTLQPFRLYGTESSPIVYNVVGRLEGNREGAGYYILSGHYDSIGSRTKYDGRDWDWRTDPAPGGDDNSSGVASVLECARVLAGVDLDFDLVFILFSGEEQIVKGSSYYVDNMEETDGPLLGVLNMDMIAYNPGQDTVFVVTDERGMWLADFLVDSYQDLAPEVGDLTIVPALKTQYLFSDETPFQLEGIPAITLSEKLEVSAHNPYYHTVDDHNVDGKLNISQATKATKLVVGSIVALAARQDPPDLEVLSGDIVFSAPPLPVVSRAEAGDTVTVSVRVRNVGGPMTEPQGIKVTIYDGDPDLAAPVLAEDVVEREIPAMGGFLFEPKWVVDEKDRGSHRITVVVSAEGEETNAANNRARAVFAVVGRELAVLEHYVYPNPGDPVAGEAVLHYFLTVPSGVTVDVFDAIGRRQGAVHRLRMGGSRIPGYNLAEVLLPLNEVVEDFSDRPGGIYFYRITAEDEESRQQVFGRFILVR